MWRKSKYRGGEKSKVFTGREDREKRTVEKEKERAERQREKMRNVLNRKEEKNKSIRQMMERQQIDREDAGGVEKKEDRYKILRFLERELKRRCCKYWEEKRREDAAKVRKTRVRFLGQLS